MFLQPAAGGLSLRLPPPLALPQFTAPTPLPSVSLSTQLSTLTMSVAVNGQSASPVRARGVLRASSSLSAHPGSDGLTPLPPGLLLQIALATCVLVASGQFNCPSSSSGRRSARRLLDSKPQCVNYNAQLKVLSQATIVAQPNGCVGSAPTAGCPGSPGPPARLPASRR